MYLKLFCDNLFKTVMRDLCQMTVTLRRLNFANFGDFEANFEIKSCKKCVTCYLSMKFPQKK